MYALPQFCYQVLFPFSHYGTHLSQQNYADERSRKVVHGQKNRTLFVFLAHPDKGEGTTTSKCPVRLEFSEE